jgi:hypothetical protein
MSDGEATPREAGEIVESCEMSDVDLGPIGSDKPEPDWCALWREFLLASRAAGWRPAEVRQDRFAEGYCGGVALSRHPVEEGPAAVDAATRALTAR